MMDMNNRLMATIGREFPQPFEHDNPDADQLFQDGRSSSDQLPPRIFTAY